MTSRFAPLLAACLVLPAAAARAEAPSGPITAREILASMLASDSVQVTRVEITVTETTDSSGQKKPDLASKRVAINQVRGAWLKRFAANFIADGQALRAELCPTPKALPGAEKPWMCSVLWIHKTGRGQAYVDFANGCGFAGIQGRAPAGVDLGTHTDSLLALFREALPRDSVLRDVKLAPGAAAAEKLPAYGEFVEADTAPQVIEKVTPEFPEDAKAAGVVGIVMLQALVGRDGHVLDARVSMGDPRLAAAAIAAVRKWRFRPAEFKNHPIALWVGVPVTFTQTPAAKP